jgi:hypothetical protein
VLARRHDRRPVRVHRERGGATISGFSVTANGALTLLDPSGATAALGAGAHPLDEAVSADGSLSPLGEVGTLPAGAVGLASS